jgi:hypothetical protein
MELVPCWSSARKLSFEVPDSLVRRAMVAPAAV